MVPLASMIRTIDVDIGTLATDKSMPLFSSEGRKLEIVEDFML